MIADLGQGFAILIRLNERCVELKVSDPGGLSIRPNEGSGWDYGVRWNLRTRLC